MKILIAEDDVTSRTMLRAICMKWGYQPIAVEDGEQAWLVMREEKEPPRLLLLDWEMPNLSGIDLCQRIRTHEESSDPPYIILLTARSDTSDIVIGLEAGANDYIAKPYDMAELEARLRVGKRMLNLQSELHRTRDALAYQASHDSLTGILNRRSFFEHALKLMELNRESASPLCMLSLDLDHFKRINDSHGHLAGDRVLVEFVELCRSMLEEGDLFARFGGEEFVILLGKAQRDETWELAERIRSYTEEASVPWDNGCIQFTVSVGISCTDGSSGTLDSLLSSVDRALYLAKEGGRNQIKAYLSEAF